jgi:L-rhamnose isomerase/sugar isomerase
VAARASGVFASRATAQHLKTEDCETVPWLVRVTPGISLHSLIDGASGRLRTFAESRGLFVDSMNSNTFQDQPGQPLSPVRQPEPYRSRGPAGHRPQYRGMEIGRAARRASHGLDGDGANFPGSCIAAR